MKKIKDYMLLSKEERQKHLDLTSPCIIRLDHLQYKASGYSYMFKGLLAHYLNTTIPLNPRKGPRILLAHACNNAKCCNPKHLYWATDKENIQDSGTCHERMQKKYGSQWKSIVVQNNKHNGKKRRSNNNRERIL